ncbi:MAG: undecaprenyldiphospho-muramoylpentapeptide beta-N-acetylglucosaminyltransferase [Steroidobacteraceae bacterium]
MSQPVMIMAGGTGGHVFPALAVANELRARREIVWLGTERGIEARLVPVAGYPVEWIEVEGLRGKGLARWIRAPLLLARAVRQARSALRRRRPGVVLGCGGFVSGPGGIAAWLAGAPLVIHEQNAVAGLTNRWLAHIASRIAEGFPGSFPARRRALYVGNPVRAEIAALSPPRQRFDARSGPMRLFVFGGSQGSSALNRLLPAAIALLPESRRPAVLHQSGARDRDATKAAYRNAGVQADVRAFIDDMAAAYANADLVVSRAGALTVAELAAAGVGSILIPFPAAVDDHQAKNAAWLGRVSAAQVVPETGLTAAELANRLATLLGNGKGRARLLAMAEAARALAVTDAAERVAALCLEAEAARA